VLVHASDAVLLLMLSCCLSCFMLLLLCTSFCHVRVRVVECALTLTYVRPNIATHTSTTTFHARVSNDCGTPTPLPCTPSFFSSLRLAIAKFFE
jgi:hypothetical protein